MRFKGIEVATVNAGIYGISKLDALAIETAPEKHIGLTCDGKV